jgi:hypothetical protein
MKPGRPFLTAGGQFFLNRVLRKSDGTNLKVGKSHKDYFLTSFGVCF